VIEVPFEALFRAGGFRVEHWERDGVTRPVWFFEHQGDTIWGATARILRAFLDLLDVDGPAAGSGQLRPGPSRDGAAQGDQR